MTTRTVDTPEKHDLAINYVTGLVPPYILSVKMGKHRSVEQNRLQRLWCDEISEQMGDQTPEEVRGFCKAWFGIPIRMEDEIFAEAYDRLIKPRSYEEKMAMMMVPIDLPVTRDMNTKQLARYLDAIYVHFTGKGIVLTEPKDRRDIGQAA